MKSLMTIVVPCYNEEEVLPLFMDAIKPVRAGLAEGCFHASFNCQTSSLQTKISDNRPSLPENSDNGPSIPNNSEAAEILTFTPCDTEIIFIDDGSKDNTLELLRGFCESDTSVHYISFSRNFGKEAGIYAGLKEAKGDYVVLLDADLQHPVEFIPKMYEILSKGKNSSSENAPDEKKVYDSVAMCRSDRCGENRIRSFFSKRFYRMINRISKIDLVDGATDYRMMTRQMLDAVLSIEEYNRFTKGIFNWVGFNTCWLPYHNVERKAGNSKWSFISLLKYSLDGMFAFSTTPLTCSFSLGLIFCIMSLIFAVYCIVRTIIWGDPVAGFPTLFCMITFFGGVQLLFLGILGQYFSKMYMEVKKRPIYIVKESR
ncbi:MAG: glycosyltransferase family 2 protein [Lachnospiraceae bacterium]|nr:glycosyltransferase family 2 protein [Lachnospiraceae bacterium]